MLIVVLHIQVKTNILVTVLTISFYLRYSNFISLLVGLPELASDVTCNNAEGVPQYSSGTLDKRKPRRRTGRLVTVNNQKIALLKYKGTVYAVDEMCPHMGE